MSVSSIMEKITGLQRKREQQRDQDYTDIVAAIATGGDPGPDDVDRVLAESDKTVNDLRIDVERYQERTALKAMVASMPKLEQEREVVLKQIATADKLLKDAERINEETTFPLAGCLRELNAAIRDATEAQSELLDSCDDSNLLSEREQWDIALQRLVEESNELASKAAYFEDKSETEFMLADREVNLNDRQHRREKSEALKKEAGAIRRKIKSNEKSQSDAVAKRDEVENQMRES